MDHLRKGELKDLERPWPGARNSWIKCGYLFMWIERIVVGSWKADPFEPRWLEAVRWFWAIR